MKFDTDIPMDLDDTNLEIVQVGRFTKYGSKGGIYFSG